MTAVVLNRLWFGPGGTRYRQGTYDVFPEDLLIHLPSSARIDGKPADDWRDEKKRKEVPLEAFATNLQVDSTDGESFPDPNAKSVQVPANGEGEGPTSPKSSGPETTALPSDTSKVGPVTASGTEGKKK